MNNFVEALKSLGVVRLGVMGIVAFGLLLFFIFVSVRVTTPKLSILYSELSTIDSSSIASKLEESNIRYRISDDGSKVYVGDDNIGRARMLLAEAGLPNGGSMGYEIFDQKESFGTTEFVQNVKKVRALQGELSRTITTLGPITAARVHLVLPQRELFSRETRPATASVIVKLHPGAQLNREQISSIRYLVSAAVPKLKSGNVTIIDTEGNTLARSKDNSEDGDMLSSNAIDRKTAYERRLSTIIEEMLSQTIGFGKVRANVSAEMDFDRISTNTESYDPEGQVVRSTQVIEESSAEPGASGGDVSVENNLPGLNALESGAGGNASSNRTEEITNYEITKTITNTIKESGDVRRLSVAVMVDGSYTKTEEGEKTYQPRSQQELDQIAALVRSAIGYDADRGDTLEVINLRFKDAPDSMEEEDQALLFGFERKDLLKTAETFTIGIVGVLIILLVLKPMVGRLMVAPPRPIMPEGVDPDQQMLAGGMMPAALASPEAYAEAGIAPPPPAGSEMGSFPLPAGAAPAGGDAADSINMDQVEGRVQSSAIRKVGEIVDNHPNETVAVIRNWMSQE